MNTRSVSTLAAAVLLVAAPAAFAQTGSHKAVVRHPAPRAQTVAAPANTAAVPATPKPGVTMSQAASPSAPSAGTTPSSAAAMPGSASTPGVSPARPGASAPSTSSTTSPKVPGGATANNTAPVGNAASSQTTNH